MLRKTDIGWSDLVAGWKNTQLEMRKRLIVAPLQPLPRFVAGVDAAFSSDKQFVFAAAVVYDRQNESIVEVSHTRQTVEVPYIPGFLSFREGPAVLAAIKGLKHEYGVICFDGQGYAHPRRCGLACHVSIQLDFPGIGCAKSRLIGTFKDPAPEAGSYAALMDEDEEIGLVLRTRSMTKPIYVSIGHRVDLDSARRLVLDCSTRYRIPEPTRQADIEVAKLKRSYRP